LGRVWARFLGSRKTRPSSKYSPSIRTGILLFQKTEGDSFTEDEERCQLVPDGKRKVAIHSRRGRGGEGKVQMDMLATTGTTIHGSTGKKGGETIFT